MSKRPQADCHVFDPSNAPFSSGESGGGSDPDADAWIARMTSPTAPEQSKITALVQALKAGNNNWQYLDYLLLMDLGATNSLIECFGVTATANGGLTFDSAGVAGNGTNAYIGSGFNPSTATNYAQLDGMHATYLVTKQAGATSQRYMGGRTAVNAERITLWASETVPITAAVNSIGLRVTSTLENGIFLSTIRTDNTGIEIFKDGASLGTAAGASASPPSVEPAILANNNNGTIERYSTGKVAVQLYGSASNIDQGELNTAIANYIAA